MIASAFSLLVAALAVAPAIASPVVAGRANSGSNAPSYTTADFPDVEVFFTGNRAYEAKMSNEAPGFLRSLALRGQGPPIMSISCSDSRAPLDQVMNVLPGTFFAARNIANVYPSNSSVSVADNGARATVTYAAQYLDTRHFVVSGHYGCGGVQAAMLPTSNLGPNLGNKRIEEWVAPIRELFLSSTRSEIVDFRAAMTATSGAPKMGNAGFRALVEENVKMQMRNIAKDPLIQEIWAADRARAAGTHSKRATASATEAPLYIHGWVYDLETGLQKDLNVTISAWSNI